MTRRLPVVDVLLAATLLVAAVVANASQPWSALTAAVWVGALALRSTAPEAMVAVGAAGILGYALVPHPLDQQPFLATLLLCFSVGLHLTGRRRWTATGLLLAVSLVMTVRTTELGLTSTLITPWVILGGPVIAGALVRRSWDQTETLRHLRAELVAERAARAVAAQAAERNRIARELHDVIAHSVSVMVVQAGAAEQQLPVGSAERERVRAVRRSGREALLELRRQLGVLREEWTDKASTQVGDR